MTTVPFCDFGGDGPVLHFAHANGYPPGCYRQLIDALLPHYRVLAAKHRPLWPGATLDDVGSWHDVADDLICFLDQQGVRGVVGVGHSLGAVATMFAARKRPALFSHLILIEPVFLPPRFLLALRFAPRFLRRRLPVVQTALKRRDWWPSRPAAFEHFRAKRVFSQVPESVLGDIIEYGLQESDAGVTLAYSRTWEAHIYSLVPQVWRPVRRTTHPTLGIRGATSDTLWDAAWQTWHEAQPEATLVEVPEAGHLVPFERPAAVAQLIRDFLFKGGLHKRAHPDE